MLNIVAAGLPLILGNDVGGPNTIAGGTINGPGYLGIDGTTALHGFGTINADLGAHGILKADNGVLNFNGALLFDGLDDPDLGTADSDGILNMTNAWNTDHTESVELQGGELRGATITNDGTNGINGHGLLSARVINNTRIDAEGGTLIVETAANDNDWDGAALVSSTPSAVTWRFVTTLIFPSAARSLPMWAAPCLPTDLNSSFNLDRRSH